MTTDPKSEPSEWLPCPFCGAGTTQLRENGRIWSGMKYSEPSSVSVEHWCEKVDGQPSRMIERVGRDTASAIEAWNRRVALTPAPAQPDHTEHVLDMVPAQPEPPTAAGVEPVADVHLFRKIGGGRHYEQTNFRDANPRPSPPDAEEGFEWVSSRPLWDTPPTLTEAQCDAIWEAFMGADALNARSARALIRAAAAGGG